MNNKLFTMRTGPILLIDDDADDCEAIGEALIQAEVSNKLLCFPNGQEALAYLLTSAEQPFLILSDINMPGISGLEFRKRILENEFLRRKAIPFLFFTTSAIYHTIVEAYDMNVQGFFEKPDTLDELSALLKEICSYWQQCRHPRN